MLNVGGAITMQEIVSLEESKQRPLDHAIIASNQLQMGLMKVKIMIASTVIHLFTGNLRIYCPSSVKSAFERDLCQ